MSLWVGSLWVLSSLMLISQAAEELFPRTRGGLPQPRHPADLSAGGSGNGVDLQFLCSISLLFSQRSLSFHAFHATCVQCKAVTGWHPTHRGTGAQSPWVRGMNIWKKIDTLFSQCCCQVTTLHFLVSMATCWLTAYQ